MKTELYNMCLRHQIIYRDLNKDNLSQYPLPEGAQQRFKIALTCLSNANETLDDFIDFLKTEKYPKWNQLTIGKSIFQFENSLSDNSNLKVC